jgi:transcriptional regulator with XRE-family HTH domain
MDLPRLRRIRQGAVMSQEELAERSGVARDTISKLETGRRGAYPSTIRKLAAGLEVRPQMLMGGVEYLDEPPEEESSEKKPSKETERAKRIGFSSGSLRKPWPQASSIKECWCFSEITSPGTQWCCAFGLRVKSSTLLMAVICCLKPFQAGTAARACSPAATWATSSHCAPASAVRSIVPSPKPAYSVPGV